MTRLRSVTLAVLIASTGCYRITVATGATPSEQTLDAHWLNSFLFGLIPPRQLSSESCSQGLAQVEMRRSFLNGLVGQLTYGIYTPLSATVTCASGPVAK